LLQLESRPVERSDIFQDITPLSWVADSGVFPISTTGIWVSSASSKEVSIDAGVFFVGAKTSDFAIYASEYTIAKLRKRINIDQVTIFF